MARAARAAATTDPLGHARRCAQPSALDRPRPSATRSGGDARRDAPRLLAADNERAEVHLVARPGRADVAELVARRRRARPAGRRTRAVLPSGDPGAIPAVRERPGRRAGRGQPAGRARAGGRPARRSPTRRWLDLCAGPGGKAALLGGSAAERGARLLAVELPAAPRPAGRAGAACETPAGVGSSSPTARDRSPWRRVRSTGCSSTRRAPGSARCAGGPRRAGGGSPPTSPQLRAAAARAARAGAARPSGPAAWSRTSPARRTWPRPGRRRRRAARSRDRRRAARRPAVLPGVPGLGDGPGRPAVAAPARHRRDVPGPAPPPLTRGSR